MRRRTFLRYSGGALALAAMPAWATGLRVPRQRRPADAPRLFFSPDELPQVRANRDTELLGPLFEAWRSADLEEERKTYARVLETQDTLRDLPQAMRVVREQGIVYLVTQDEARRDLIEEGIRTALQLPGWDFMVEGGEVLGIQRASMTLVAVLFGAEVLGEAMDAALREEMLHAVAEKGCVPCFRALWGMRFPDRVEGWGFNEKQSDRYDIDMSRWPYIFDRNNLKAIPNMGLGVGALALQGVDPRADEWLDLAVVSAEQYLQLFEPDGSYYEGISYVNYALRSLFVFLDAHYRIEGDIDWVDKANFYGVAEYIAAMHAGDRPDSDAPDIVNFSDANGAVYPAVPAWIVRHGGSTLAQHVAEHFTQPYTFTDFLWYRPEAPSTPPPESLKNVRMDLDWIVARTGWEPDDSVLAFRSGMPSNHEHADRNSFLFKAYGERLLDDHFGAAYDWRQPRWALRQTDAHNAVLIDGHGHQYHEGEEGTNESLAEAHVVRYVDNDDVVWWSSDATQAYQLVDGDVAKVMRSVLFAKPGTLILFDQVEKLTTPSTVALRFHPDNRDGEAQMSVEGDGRFRIHRPGASLFGRSVASVPVQLRQGRLDLPEEEGVYPFVEVEAEEAERVALVTVLVAQPAASSQAPDPSIQPAEDGWTVRVGGHTAHVRATGAIPELVWRA